MKEKTQIIIGDLLDGELEVWKLLLGGWRVNVVAFLRLSHLIHSLKLTGKSRENQGLLQTQIKAKFILCII